MNLRDINEETHLERIANHSLYAAGVNSAAINYAYELFKRHFVPGEILELGPAEGVMTEKLIRLGFPVSVVDGSQIFCNSLKSRFPELSVTHSLFENYSPEKRYENIVLGHVLEHVLDPVGILSKSISWLKKGGRVFANVPNSRSIHRQAAVLMGLLPSENSLNDMDIYHGHRRVFDPETFRNTFMQAGFRIYMFGGFWLKPISNKQIEDTWTEPMLSAFMQLGERYPDIAGEIYIVATLSES